MSKSNSWDKIFKDNKILEHDFSESPFLLSAEMIKQSVQDFKNTAEKEVRILCKIDNREDLPEVMEKNNLILLPIKNGEYVLVKGEGFVDIPDIDREPEIYKTKLNFELETSKVGNSEMQHLDFAYASSLIRTFMKDLTLVLTIRGRKYTPEFDFRIGKQNIKVKGVQTEIDAGYEGEDKVVLIEAKNSKTTNTIIRQLYYPFRQWSEHTKKDVFLLFFEKRKNDYLIWQYGFEDKNDYNSIYLIKSKKYKIVKE
jgi:hypothetical protein